MTTDQTVEVKKKPVDTLDLKQYLALAISRCGKNNGQIAEEVGYPRGNVIAMMRSGSMKVPVNKVIPLAKSLEVDPATLLRKVLGDSDSAVLGVIEEIFGSRVVTANEFQLVQWMRTESRNLDIDWTSRTDFIEAVKPVVHKLRRREKGEAERQIELINAADGRHIPKRKAA